MSFVERTKGNAIGLFNDTTTTMQIRMGMTIFFSMKTRLSFIVQSSDISTFTNELQSPHRFDYRNSTHSKSTIIILIWFQILCFGSFFSSMWLLSHFAQFSLRFVYVIYSLTHFFVLSLDAIIMFRHVRLCHKRKSLNWCSRKVTCSLKKVTDDAHWNKLYNFEIWFHVGFFRPLCVCVLSISLCLSISMSPYISNGTKDFNRKLLMIIWHKLIFVPFFCITRQFMDEYWTKSHFCQCILYSGEKPREIKSTRALAHKYKKNMCKKYGQYR